MDEMKAIIAKKAAELQAADRPGRKWAHSPAHALADEISRAFGEPKKFAMYLGTIKRVGPERARQIFREILQDNCLDQRRLFFWRCRNDQMNVPPAGGKAPQTKPPQDGA